MRGPAGKGCAPRVGDMFNLSGLFTIALEADGTVREVSRIDGYVE